MPPHHSGFGAIHTSICRIKGPAFSCLWSEEKDLVTQGECKSLQRDPLKIKLILASTDKLDVGLSEDRRAKWMTFLFPGQYWFNFGVYFCNNSSGQRNYTSFHHFCLKFNDPGYLYFSLYFCFFYLFDPHRNLDQNKRQTWNYQNKMLFWIHRHRGHTCGC